MTLKVVGAVGEGKEWHGVVMTVEERVGFIQLLRESTMMMVLTFH